MQVQCPSCSSIVTHPDNRAGQVVNCPKCGAQMQLPGAVAPAAPAAAAPGAGTKRCPYCGESIMADAMKCRHCGEFLDAAHRRASAEGARVLEAYQKGMRILSTLLYVFGGLFLFLGGCGMMGADELARRNPAMASLIMATMVTLIVIAAVFLVMGYFARKFHSWTNWVIAILAGLLLLGNIVNWQAQGARNLVGIALFGVLLAVSIVNLVKASAVRAAGLNPTDVQPPLR